MSQRRNEREWITLGEIMTRIKNEKLLAELAIDGPFTVKDSLRIDRALIMQENQE